MGGDNHFDYIILGAGINGSGIARTLSFLGRKVLVLDKATIGSGTSSKSSRLIHGGLRYMEHLEVSLVREALKDRRRLLALYPDIIHLMPFYLPVYADSQRSAFLLSLGLSLYDIVGGSRPLHSRVEKKDFASIFQNIRTDRLRTVFQYYDAKTNDLTLVWRVAEDARSRQVRFLENTEVKEITIDEAIIAVKTEQASFLTNRLVNATGPWIDEVNERYNLPSNYKISKVSGVHIEVGKQLVPFPMVMQTKTSRIFFLIPEEKTTIVGTTERLENDVCDRVEVQEADVCYLLDNVNRYLVKPVTAGDVINTWVGVRPLIESRKDLSCISRGYKLDLHRVGRNRMLHVFGGKLTTFLSLAEKAAAALESFNGTGHN